MGMAASQARLLSITARLSNNEHSAESISYAKQKLTDKTDQITYEYNEALKATKLTVLTGFNGSEANYEDISYNLVTGLRMAENTRQYVVTDTRNRILVTEDIADAFLASKGNYNAFLAQLGYSISDLHANKDSSDQVATGEALQAIHEAWDKYFESVGIDFYDKEHESSYGWVSTNENRLGFGYATYDGKSPINYEGTTTESKNLYNYAMALTESFYRSDFNPSTIKMASDPDNTSALKYYENIFNRIQQRGFFTYTDTPAKAANSTTKENYIYSETTVGTGKVAKNPLKDNSTFESALRDGTLKLEYYSTTEKTFKSITISEDTCIQEVEDERAIARAETKYTQDMARVEQEDKQFDLNLKRLDTEHNALQTEYDSMKTIIDKNIENSFKTFS